jgi:hypothetical protein
MIYRLLLVISRFDGVLIINERIHSCSGFFYN